MARWDSKRAALFSPTHGIPHAWGIKPHGGTGPVAAEGRDASPPAGGCTAWPEGCRHPSLSSLPTGVFPGWITGQARGAAGHTDQQEHHPFPGGVQGLPGTAALQEEKGSSQRLSPPSSAAQFRLKWAVQPFCASWASTSSSRLPRSCGGPGGTRGPGGTGREAAGHRQGRMKPRFSSYFYH